MTFTVGYASAVKHAIRLSTSIVPTSSVQQAIFNHATYRSFPAVDVSHHAILSPRHHLHLAPPIHRSFSQSPFLTMPHAAATDPIREKLPSQNSNSQDEYKQRFREFDLAGKVYVVTGGAQGLGLSLAEALVEAGSTGKFSPYTKEFGSHQNLSVHCLDRRDTPDEEFEAARKRANPDYGGSLHYARTFIWTFSLPFCTALYNSPFH